MPVQGIKLHPETAVITLMEHPIRNGTSKAIQYYVDEKGCWICVSHTLAVNGYPYIRIRRKPYTMARFIYKHFKGVIPEGLHIRHTCDNRACINPEHLLIGTNADNIRDKLERGRQSKGECAGTAKLKEAEALEILTDQLNEFPSTQDELAKQYGVTRAAIEAIKTGRTWGYLYKKITGKKYSPYSKIKLTESQVVEILRDQLGNNPTRQQLLAKRYGVNFSTISCIKHGYCWRHVFEKFKLGGVPSPS